VIATTSPQNASQAAWLSIYFGTAPVNLLANSTGTVKTPE
jgi:hypothetical protein